ncbi:hypothetical protein, partial [Mesorhizobium sp. LSJC264A00]|uniref:hypothetical protein n=1 Tax=Mesorhizobium sp. LSJC264A00 TaxID=1287321 RepID=UPI001AEC5E3C
CPRVSETAVRDLAERLSRFCEIRSHAYNGHYYLYELPTADLPQKQCSRWNQLVDRVAARNQYESQAKTFN